MYKTDFDDELSISFEELLNPDLDKMVNDRLERERIIREKAEKERIEYQRHKEEMELLERKRMYLKLKKEFGDL